MQTTKTMTLAAAAALTLAALTGCTSGAQPNPAPETTPPAATEPAPNEATNEAPSAESGGVSERGNQIIAIGAPVDLFDADLPVGTFTVESVEPVEETEGNSPESPNRQHYVISLRVETTSDLTSPINFNYDVVGTDGVTINDEQIHPAGGTVIPDAEGFPVANGVGPAQTVVGKVLMSVPEGPAVGTLIILPKTTATGASMYGYEIAL